MFILVQKHSLNFVFTTQCSEVANNKIIISSPRHLEPHYHYRDKDTQSIYL